MSFHEGCEPDGLAALEAAGLAGLAALGFAAALVALGFAVFLTALMPISKTDLRISSLMMDS